MHMIYRYFSKDLSYWFCFSWFHENKVSLKFLCDLNLKVKRKNRNSVLSCIELCGYFFLLTKWYICYSGSSYLVSELWNNVPASGKTDVRTESRLVLLSALFVNTHTHTHKI